MTELYINGQLIEMPENLRAAMTFQINDIAELKNRQANYSNTFKIPKTLNNRKVLGSLEDITLQNRVPYETATARLISDGVEIVGEGLANIKSAGDDYSITLFSGNIDFFEIIKGKKLKDLDLSTWDIDWDSTTLQSKLTNNIQSNAFMPYLATGNNMFPEDRFVNAMDRNVYWLTATPFVVYVKNLFNKVFEEAGISYSSIILNNDALFEKLLLLCSKGYDANRGDGFVKKFTVSNVPGSYITNPLNITSNSLTIFGLFAFVDGNTGGSFTVDSTITITNVSNGQQLVLSFTQDNNTVGSVKTIISADPFYSSVTLTNGQLNNWLPGNYLFTSSANYYVDGGRESTPASAIDYKVFAPDLLTGVEIFGQKIGGANLQNGYGKLSISETLPDMLQSEFIKEVAQIFGLIFQPDKNGNIEIENFTTIVNNIPKSKDWSDKLDLSITPVIEWKFGTYGQVNYLKWSDADEILNNSKYESSILFDNKALKPSSNLLDLIGVNTDNVPTLNYWDATFDPGHSVPFVNMGELPEKVLEEGEVRFLIADRKTYTIGTGLNEGIYLGWENQSVSPVLNGTFTINQPYFVENGKALQLGFQQYLKDQYYGELAEILKQAKVITANFLLSSQDIATLDHFTPVYVQYFGNYFYVNKVSNFVARQRTKVTLIKL